MSESNKNIISFLLLLLFLAPLVVKIEHKHKHERQDRYHVCVIVSSTEKEKLSYQKLHEECPICQYEFLFLLTAIKDTESKTKTLGFELLNNYTSILILGTEINSLSLRAPPAFIL